MILAEADGGPDRTAPKTPTSIAPYEADILRQFIEQAPLPMNRLSTRRIGSLGLIPTSRNGGIAPPVRLKNTRKICLVRGDLFARSDVRDGN